MRLALVGAGSAVFARTLLVDLLLSPLEGVTVRLVDPNPRRLEVTLRLGRYLLERFPQKGFALEVLGLREALEGAEVVVLVADVGARKPSATITRSPSATGWTRASATPWAQAA